MNTTEAIKTLAKLGFGAAAVKLGWDEATQAQALDLAVAVGGAVLAIVSAVKMAVPAVRGLWRLIRPAAIQPPAETPKP